MSNTERVLGEEKQGRDELARVFYGEDDFPELWRRAGLRMPEANIISGAERGAGSLHPVLGEGVTVVLQKDNPNALVLRGAVEEEDHMSLSSVAHEASKKRGRIPEAPEVRGLSLNDEVSQRAIMDWQNSYDNLVKTSANAQEAIQNSAAWLILDAKDDLEGFALAKNDWQKDLLDAHLINLDKGFGKEVKKLREKYRDRWTSVVDTDGPMPTNNIASRVFTGVALGATLPFNPAMHMQNVPAIYQPADGEVQIAIEKAELERMQVRDFVATPQTGNQRNSLSPTVMAIDFYEQYVDKLIPDTPQGNIEKAAEVLGLSKEADTSGGFSELAKYAYDATLLRGGTEKDASFAVKAAAMGFFQSNDGAKWYHVYGLESANVEEVTREQVEENTSVKAIAAALTTAFQEGGWDGGGPVNPSPDNSASPVPPVEIPTSTPEAQQTGIEGRIGIGSDFVEQSFVAQHPEFNTDQVTPVTVTIEGKNFNLVEIEGDRYYMEINGQWKEVFSSDRNIGGQDFIVLQYFSRLPQVGEVVQSEPVLWYPAMTKDQWNALTPEEKQRPWVYFAPPSELANELPDYDRATDQGIPLEISPEDENPFFLVSYRVNDTVVNPSAGATQLPPAESLAGTPPAPTPTEVPTSTPEVKQFNICGQENWKDCELSIRDLMPNGDYWRWVDQNWNPNLPEPSPENQFILTQSDQIIFLSADKQHPIPNAARPYIADFTYGYVNCGVSWGGESHEMTCPVVPIALSIPGRPGETVKIIGIIEKGYNEADSNIKNYFRDINGNHALMLGGYEIDPTGNLVLKGGDTIDFMQQYINAYPDLYERIQKFQETNDPTFIEGIVFKVFTLH